MEGIHFVTNDEGDKVAVMIDLAKYGDLWEDFHDHLIADSRADEKNVSLAELKRRLQRRKQRARA